MRVRPGQGTFSLSLAVIFCCATFLASTSAAPIQTVWAATIGDRDKRPRESTQRTNPRVKATAASLAPVTVHNFRVMASPEKTRLVLDLDRDTTVMERRAKNPSRVVIALPNASLSRSALAKAADGTVPPPFMVTHTATRAVVVSFPTAAFRSYKHFTLSNPPRLVVDITPRVEQGLPPTSETQEPLPIPSPPAIQPTAPPDKGYKTIVIDPGHGGRDSGARGRRFTEEKDITLKVGLRLRDLLRKQPGVRVLMTRESDIFVELDNRAKFANSNQADLFVSIHVNSHPSRQVKGIEIYHFGEAKDQRALEVAARENGTPLSSTGVGWEYLVADLLTTKKTEASLELAWTAKEAMVTHMNGHYAVNDNGVKTAPFYVLRFTSMPSILAEIAYISNPAEEDLLRKPTFIRHVAQALFQGVESFLAANKSAIR
jgi:N-acetylmuramoyl-L-alanine amidase